MIMKIVVFVGWPTGRVCGMPVCIDIRWPFQHAVHHLLSFCLGYKIIDQCRCCWTSFHNCWFLSRKRYTEETAL